MLSKRERDGKEFCEKNTVAKFFSKEEIVEYSLQKIPLREEKYFDWERRNALSQSVRKELI